MDINFFKKTRILDGGMGQELLARGMKPQGTLWSATALLNKKYILGILGSNVIHCEKEFRKHTGFRFY